MNIDCEVVAETLGKGLFASRQWLDEAQQPRLRVLQREQTHPAFQLPDLPPDFSRSRMFWMTMPLSSALPMS